jgi:hypothetical protein
MPPQPDSHRHTRTFPSVSVSRRLLTFLLLQSSASANPTPPPHPPPTPPHARPHRGLLPSDEANDIRIPPCFAVLDWLPRFLLFRCFFSILYICRSGESGDVGLAASLVITDLRVGPARSLPYPCTRISPPASLPPSRRARSPSQQRPAEDGRRRAALCIWVSGRWG